MKHIGQRWVAAMLLGASAVVAAQEPAEQAQEPTEQEAQEPGEQAPAAPQQPLETIPVDSTAAAPDAVQREYPYTWGAARLRHTEYDENATDAFGVEGSYLLLPNVYAVGALFLGESDDEDSTESTQFEIGAGYRGHLTPAVDLNATFRFVSLRVDTHAGPISDEVGYQFDVGARTKLLDRLEGSAGLQYLQIFEAGHTFLVGSALYEVLPQLSVGADAVLGNSSMSYGLLGRWAF